MMKCQDIRKEDTLLHGILCVALICAGLFHTYIACGVAAILALVLLLRLIRGKSITLYGNITTIAILVITLGYGVSIFGAVDPGMAFLGFVKMLSVPLFLLLLNHDECAKKNALKNFPYIVAVLAGVSMLLSLLCEDYFLVAGRLAGTFQYPNTFAMVLLVAELQLVAKRKINGYTACALLVLIAGLLYTGSRTVFALAIVSNVAMLFFALEKKKRWIAIVTPMVFAGMVVVWSVLSGSDVLGRFLRFSLTESTFAGRLLYAYDALPLIVKYSFGMGAMGYHYMQQSVQTGVYATMYVHNDLLQMVLDIGWIPTLFWIVSIVCALLKKENPISHRICLAVMIVHSCFDFDFQFVAVYYVFLLLMDTGSGKKFILRPTNMRKILLGAVAAIAIYTGVATTLPELGLGELGRTMYPWNTYNNTELLVQIENLEEAEKEADRILAQNEYVNVAHSVKAHCAYAKGDFPALMERKGLILRMFPFQYEEYVEYCQMLINGAVKYRQMGDAKSYAVCLQVLNDTVRRLESLQERLSDLGSIIKDQPKTELPAELAEEINNLLQS